MTSMARAGVKRGATQYFADKISNSVHVLTAHALKHLSQYWIARNNSGVKLMEEAPYGAFSTGPLIKRGNLSVILL